MTAKERRQMQALQNEVDTLRSRHDKHMEVYRDNLDRIVDLELALKNAHGALVDAVLAINPVIRSSGDVSDKISVDTAYKGDW